MCGCVEWHWDLVGRQQQAVGAAQVDSNHLCRLACQERVATIIYLVGEGIYVVGASQPSMRSCLSSHGCPDTRSERARARERKIKRVRDE